MVKKIMELNYSGRSRGGGYSGYSWMRYSQRVKSREEAIELMKSLKGDLGKNVKDFDFSQSDEFYINSEKEKLEG